jgi:ubiquinone biosynthesis protein
VLERLAPTRLVKSATMSGWHLMNVLRNAPSQIRDISRRLALGKWQVTIRHRNLDDLAHEIDKASNRLSFAVIIGCIVLGSSWLLTMSGGQTLLRIPLQLVGIAGYLLAGIMGAWLLFAILRSGKLS